MKRVLTILDCGSRSSRRADDQEQHSSTCVQHCLASPSHRLPSPTQETTYTLECNSGTSGTYEHTMVRVDGFRLLCSFALIGGRAASRTLSRRWNRQSWQPSWPRRVFIRPTERNVRRRASTNEVVCRASSAVLTLEARCRKGMAVRPPQSGGDWGRRA